MAAIVCAAAVFLAYGNSTHGAFALDDWHSIQQNPRVRSLADVQHYFVDASTFSILPPNADYRPVLQTTYALNYALAKSLFGDGYDVRVWHWTNLLLHASVCLSLYFLGRRLIGSGGLANLPGLSARSGDVSSLVAAALFAVHPLTTGCANYISARSSLLVAAFALPAVNLYLRVLACPERRRPLLGAAALYALALLTKVEAVSVVAVLATAELLLAQGVGDVPLWRRLLRVEPWRRLGGFVVLTLAYLALWKIASPLSGSAHLAAADMTPYSYFCTQLSAWWYYVRHIFLPLDLVADELDFPISRSLLEPRTALALAGWTSVGLAAAFLYRIAPAVTFLVASSFLYLLPHSSVVPLAEMVNEHRPYLPSAGLFLVGAAAGALFLARVSRQPMFWLTGIAVVLAVPLVVLTRARNLVWADDLTLWLDTATKTPNSARAQVNYGQALLRRGFAKEAEARYRIALRLDPNNAYLHTNLGVVLDEQGDAAAATVAHDRAVALAGSDAAPFYWRGLSRVKHGQIAAAIDDFETAAGRNPAPLDELAALAECSSELGRSAEAQRAIAAGSALDASGFAAERARFRATFLAARGAGDR